MHELHLLLTLTFLSVIQIFENFKFISNQKKMNLKYNEDLYNEAKKIYLKFIKL